MAQNQARQGEQRVHWWHPGEVAVVARVPNGTSEGDLRGVFPQRSQGLMRDDPQRVRSFIFSAPDEPRSLAFTFVELTSASAARDVRDAVERLNDSRNDLRTGDVEVLGVMPHWHLRAHEVASGGSPGSQPAPVRPGDFPGGAPRRIWYAPTLEKLARQSDSAVPVAVLDTRLNLADVRQRADKLGNDQLRETVDLLSRSSQDGAAYGNEWREVEQHHAELAANAGELKTYDMADHGLFIAGLIHAAAPGAPIRYEPVLDDTGVGDLSLMLLALQRVLAAKQPSDPQIINLSFGFRPHPSRLAQVWYGLERPGDELYSPVPELQDRDHDLRWASSHKRQILDHVDLLRVGLDELGRYLSLNNCLVVAAAGNDSLRAVDQHLPRLDPRLPASFDSVLGVAATLADGQPAPYSNAGDDLQLGDHLATFGGGVGSTNLPVDGVMGIYSGEFPSPSAQDGLGGWAFWSGTSFATGIISGIAANFWGQQRGSHAIDVRADLHAEASANGSWQPELRTPVIKVERRTN